MQSVSLGDTVNSRRAFKNKWFNHWASKEGISDAVLRDAAVEIAAGQVEADLGGCLFKKRLPRPGGGKRGGYRVIVGVKRPDSERVIFLYAFAKSDKANISASERKALSLTAEAFLSATDRQVDGLLADGKVWEVPHHE